MTSLEVRIKALEGALSMSESAISDERLAAAMNANAVDDALIRALYQRIERPFVSSIILHASWIRASWQETQPEVMEWGEFRRLAFSLARPTPYEDPNDWIGRDVRHIPLKRYPVDRPSLGWEPAVQLRLVRQLLNRFDRERLLDKVDAVVGAGITWESLTFIPTLSMDERDRLLDLVDALEPKDDPRDLAALVWLDDDGIMNSSRKPRVRIPNSLDTAGQRWTRLGG